MNALSVCIAVGPSESFAPLRDTLDSVRRQIAGSVEVVVKALGSHLQDDIARYVQEFPSFQLQALGGADAGIYDAMNICAKAARGNHVLYLGCGDTLADVFVVTDLITAAAKAPMAAVTYGPVLMADSAGRVLLTFDNRLFFGQRARTPWRNPCHSQGLFYRRDWLVERPFRTDVGPLADMVHTYQHGVHLHACWLNRPVAMFRAGGVSNRRDAKGYANWLKGVHANCENFRCSAGWKVVSSVVCKIGIALGR